MSLSFSSASTMRRFYRLTPPGLQSKVVRRKAIKAALTHSWRSWIKKQMIRTQRSINQMLPDHNLVHMSDNRPVHILPMKTLKQLPITIHTLSIFLSLVTMVLHGNPIHFIQERPIKSLKTIGHTLEAVISQSPEYLCLVPDSNTHRILSSQQRCSLVATKLC